MTARTIERYFASQIYAAVALVLAGFLALFAFFDLVNELGDLDIGEYHLREILTYVALTVPAHAYELFPVVVLIGTLYVLAALASNSEYTVMRAAGFSPRDAGRTLVKIGLAFVALTFVLGEWIAPAAEQAAQTLKMRAKSSLIGQELKSGLWFKDERSFINVREARQDNALTGVRIYEFDKDYKLSLARAAERGEYLGNGVWRLFGVAQTRLTAQGPRVEKIPELDWRTALTPDLLNVLIVAPEADVGVATVQVHRAPRGEPPEDRALRDRDVEETRVPDRDAGDDGARPAVRLHARAGRPARCQSVFRHHAGHRIPHAQQPVLAYRPAAELDAVHLRGPAERGVSGGGDADDVVGGTPLGWRRARACPSCLLIRPTSTSRVPASLSCRNWRSRSKRAQPRPTPENARVTNATHGLR